MPSKDFVPHKNSLFDNWQENLVNVANDCKEAWGLSNRALGEWELLTNTSGKKKKRWETIWAVVSSKNFTHSDETELLSARKDYESGNKNNPDDTSLRIFISRYIRFNKNVTVKQKEKMGLTIPKATRSKTLVVDENQLAGNLSGRVIKNMNHCHVSEIGVPGRKSKALEEGVKSIQVFIAFTPPDVKVAPPIKEFNYDGVADVGKHIHIFEADMGLTRVWYYARREFKEKKNTYGPPSIPWSALIE
ncbi:MAG: hypothetical protein WCH34_17420 [Bacteroidota bacterium]